jgi:hypothetical protein
VCAIERLFALRLFRQKRRVAVKRCDGRASLANIASGDKSLTLARLLAILQAMSHAFRMVAALWSALCTRKDLVLETLALRHQLGVLACSVDAFARLTVCSGSACDGGGLGGGTR